MTEPTQPTTPIKLLCIEDEYFIGNLYSRALGRAGYVVTLEQDGQKGFELAASDRFDIILLDLMLPTLSGIEILKRLRGEGQKAIRAKIIITTNLEEQGKTREDIERHADGYLIKAAVTPKQLVEFLSKIKTS
jgi:DNA-binding response OmpR family regulator